MNGKLTGLAKVHQVLVDECKKRNQPYLTLNEARQTIQMGLGYVFPRGTRIENIYEQLTSHELITSPKSVVLNRRIIIPL